MTPELLALADLQGGALTAAQTCAAGLTHDQRHALLKSGSLLELRRGIVSPRALWDAEDFRGRHRIALAGALLIRGWRSGATSHRYVGGMRTAAFLLHLPVLPDPAVVAALHQGCDPRDLTSEGAALRAEVAQIRRGQGPRRIDLVDGNRSRRTYAHGVNVRPATLPPGHVVLNGAVPITSLARTAVDLMREGSRADALIMADGVLREGLERAELEAMAQFCAGWSNGKQAVEAAARADARAASAAESLARFHCIEEPLCPEADLQVRLYDADGLIGIADLFFLVFRTVVEVDGLIKVTDPWCGDAEEAMRRQEAREARLRRAGWKVVRTTWEELTTDPAGFIRRLLVTFAQAA